MVKNSLMNGKATLPALQNYTVPHSLTIVKMMLLGSDVSDRIAARSSLLNTFRKLGQRRAVV